jgi:UDP-N-acetylmuramate dehydrogenase
MQNIGAYGVEIKDTCFEVEAYNIETNEVKIFSNADCKFGYRESVFKHEAKGKYIISSVTFRLAKQAKINVSYGAIQDVLKSKSIENPTIQNVSEAVIAIRESKLPNPKVLGNAGSFFKNPEVPTEEYLTLKEKHPALVGYKTSETYTKLAAGWLIEQCGWKGKIVGNTGSHKDQALVLVNYGNATGNEIWKLATQIQESVFEKFGVTIVPEVNVI